MTECITIKDLISLIEEIRPNNDKEWDGYDVGFDDGLRYLSDMLYANEDNSLPIFDLEERLGERDDS